MKSSLAGAFFCPISVNSGALSYIIVHFWRTSVSGGGIFAPQIVKTKTRMATQKITQKTIKDMVKSGAAIDLEKMQNPPKRRELEVIGISKGTSGMNGALFLHSKNKKMYAITSRSSMLFEYV